MAPQNDPFSWQIFQIPPQYENAALPCRSAREKNLLDARAHILCLSATGTYVRTNERTNASFVWLVKTPRATIQAINTFKAGLDDWLMPHYYNYYYGTTTPYTIQRMVYYPELGFWFAFALFDFELILKKFDPFLETLNVTISYPPPEKKRRNRNSIVNITVFDLNWR